MNVRNTIALIALVTMLLASTMLIHLPLVHAYFTVGHASFPPDLPGDVTGPTTGVPDNVVNMRDIAFVINHCFSYFGDSKWDPRADVDDNGVINMRDVAAVQQLFNKHYTASLVPIAYSTSLEFDVPTDGDFSVVYYILARVYVPGQLSNQNFYLDAQKSVDDTVKNVKVDNVMQFYYETTGLFSIALGQLSSGFHLIELQYTETAGAGLINFTVETSAHAQAWLDRCRICVPYYSDNMIEYTVVANATFIGGDFFLRGNTTTYIDNVRLDNGQLWSGWMWNADQGGTIYGWGDGFMYPLGAPGSGVHDISFTYGNKNAGMLDFQLISRENNPDRIGAPKFYASAGISNLGPHVALNTANIYGGSRWASDPGVSQRNYTILTTYNFGYSDDVCWFNVLLSVELGNWWATWELGGSQPPDFAIPLNFTVASLTSDRSTGQIAGTTLLWDVHLKNYKIDTYSFQSLRIQGIENGEGQSSGIMNDWAVALDFGGTTTMAVTALIPIQGIPVIGAGVGLIVYGMAAAIDYVQGQHVSEYDKTIQQDNHWQLTANHPMDLSPDTNGSSKSKSELIFLKTTPQCGYRCGLTEVVLEGSLDAEYKMISPGGYTQTYSYPLGDINVTLCIPWFIWSLT